MKTLVTGIWGVVVALGTTYFVASLDGTTPGAAKGSAPVALQTEKTRVINVPMIANGAIRGYIVAQFAYTVDPKQAKTLSVSPDVFLLDEAFRKIYTDDRLDFLHLEKYDIGALTAHLAKATNKRLGIDLVHDVLVQDFTYISKEENER